MFRSSRIWVVCGLAALAFSCKKTSTTGTVKEDGAEAPPEGGEPPAEGETSEGQAIPNDGIGKVLAADAEYRDMRTALFAIKPDQAPYSPDQRQAYRGAGAAALPKVKLSKMFDATSDRFDSLKSANAKLVALVAGLIRPARGIFYRAAPIVEDARAVHNFLLASLKRGAENFKFVAPSAQAAVLWQYFSEPFDADEPLGENSRPAFKYRFGSLDEMGQKWLCHAATPDAKNPTVYDSLELAVKRANALEAKQPIYVDLQMVYGENSFKTSDENRYLAVTDVELRVLSALLKVAQSAIAVECSYNLTDLVKIAGDVTTRFGMQTVANKIEGLSIEMRASAAGPAGDNKFGAVRSRAGMTDALAKLRSARADAVLAWSKVKARLDGNRMEDNAVINIMRFKSPKLRKNMERDVTAMAALVPDGAATAQLRSPITQEVVTVDLTKFYTDPPNLLALMPTEFAPGGTEEPKYGFSQVANLATGEDAKVRDYYQGSAKSWNAAVWGKYIPSIASGQTVPQAVRIINEAPGGQMLGYILSSFVY